MFKKPFSFDGRIGRAEYFFSYAASWTTLLGLHIATFTIRWGILFVFAGCIPLIWLMLAQGVKRCHDTDNSGWLQLIPGFFFWMMFAAGDPESNKYGPNPK
ncbi:DUF805 domain-containing protein [Dyadobacter sp. MSC1_007]|jgi:uncharacterized membrane protein YhaH (DUF805 family)|uniref:DUF805 domain-containing protein n=1 Tax=Dyadobacter sp. MSC1_007 TaxID=2909264 RepID=UPI0038D40C2F